MSPPGAVRSLSEAERRRLFEAQREQLKQGLAGLEPEEWEQVEDHFRRAMEVESASDPAPANERDGTPPRAYSARADEGSARAEGVQGDGESELGGAGGPAADGSADGPMPGAYTDPQVAPPPPPPRFNHETGRWEVYSEWAVDGWKPVDAPPLEPSRWNAQNGEWEPCPDSEDPMCIDPATYSEGEDDEPEGKDADPQECGFACSAIAWGYGIGKWAAGTWGTIRNALDGIDWNTVGHTALDVGGLIEPFGIGIASDAVNTAWYASEGNWLDAALSAISIIPIIGDAIGKGGKVAIRLGGAALRNFMKAIKEFGGLSKIREFFAKIPGVPGKKMEEAFEGFYRESREKLIKENADAPFATTKWTNESEEIYKRLYGEPVWTKGGNKVWMSAGDPPYLFGDHASLLEFKKTFADSPFGNNPAGAFKGWDSHHVIEAIDLETLGLENARGELYRRLPAVLLPPEGHARLTSILSSYRPFHSIEDLREAYEIAYDTLGLPADELMDVLDEILIEGAI